MAHKCPTILNLAALHLSTNGELSAHTATYDGLRCPFTSCGKKHFTTRLASTMHTLRHDYGWDIETVREDGLQANYLMRKVGEMPKDPAAIPDDLPHWECTAMMKRTNRIPRGRASHKVEYPDQPEQPTADGSGRLMFGRCKACEYDWTVWRRLDGPAKAV